MFYVHVEKKRYDNGKQLRKTSFILRTMEINKKKNPSRLVVAQHVCGFRLTRTKVVAPGSNGQRLFTGGAHRPEAPL